MKTIHKWIDESDVYMLIFGGRYGSIEQESGLSYTELEYNYALSKGMPVFAVVLDDKFLFTKAASDGKDKVFETENIQKYNDFKAIIMKKIHRVVQNIDQIQNNITLQLYDILEDEDYNLCGWVKGKNEMPSNINAAQKKDTYDNHYAVSYVKTREEIDEKLNPLKNMFVDVRSKKYDKLNWLRFFKLTFSYILDNVIIIE